MSFQMDIFAQFPSHIEIVFNPFPQIWRDIYMIIIAVLSACTLGFQIHPRFFTHSWFYTRMAVYVGLAAYGIIPTIHWIYLNGGVDSMVVKVIDILTFQHYGQHIRERERERDKKSKYKCVCDGGDGCCYHILLSACTICSIYRMINNKVYSFHIQ